MKLEILKELNAERAARRPVIVVTDTASGEQRLVKAKDIAADPLRAELAKQLRMGKSGNVEAGGKKLFLNVYAPTAKLVIIGAVHISQALAPMARSLDYDVTVVDPRTAFASPERFPDVPLIAEWPDVALPPLNVDHYTAFVAVTHDPKIDDPALLHAFASATASISARSARGRRMPSAPSGCGRRAPPRPTSRASTRRSGSTSARCRRRRSRSPSWPRSPRSCACRPKKKNRRHEVRPGEPEGCDRRRDRAHAAPGRAGAQEGHHDRRGRGRGAGEGRRQGDRRGAAGGRATSPRTSRPPASRRRWPATASMSSAPSPDDPICSRRAPACWWSIAPRSTASMASTRRSRLRRCRPSSRSSKAR